MKEIDEAALWIRRGSIYGMSKELRKLGTGIIDYL